MRRGRLVVPAALLVLAFAFSLAWPRAITGRAPAGTAKPFAWVAMGDHLDRPADGLVEGIVKARPAVVVDVGDVVYESKPDEFDTVKKLIVGPLAAAGARLYPVAGNHDFPVRPHWFEFWAPPANKLYYCFDYGNSHFVILDTNRAFLMEGEEAERKFEPGTEQYAMQTQAQSFEPGSAQYQWLQKDLASTKKRHIFVFFHEPAFSFGGHDGSRAIQRLLCPLFEQYKVTAVFSGHSHGYERFVPLRVDLSSGRPAPVADKRNGVVYVVTAGGGMPLYDITPNKLHAATAKAFHFVRIDVGGDTASCAVIEAKTGRVLDAFELKSRRQGCSDH